MAQVRWTVQYNNNNNDDLRKGTEERQVNKVTSCFNLRFTISIPSTVTDYYVSRIILLSIITALK